MSESRIPWSREAEQSVLGGLMIDNAAIDLIPELAPSDFFDGAHRRIFGALQGLLRGGTPADVVTVFERIQASGEDDDAGGLSYLNALSQCVPSASNIQRYAAIVMDRAKARALLAAGSDAMAAAQDHSAPVDERIERVASGLMKLLEQTARDDVTPLGELLVRHTELIEARAAGQIRVVPTGLVDLDDLLGGGPRPGNLVILGGRPSMGKTAAALTIAMHMAGSLGVGFLSMEMSKEELGDRSTALLGRIDLADVQRPPKSGPAADMFWGKLVDAAELAASKKLYVDDQGALTLAQVRAKARAMKRKFGIGVLVIDYLQLMTGTDPKAMRTYQLEDITRGLKALAKELGIVVLVLAQVKRTVDGMPGLSDLKDSGAIEQDADVVVFIHRPIVNKPDLPDEFRHYAQAFLAKNRQGPTGLINLAYVGKETRFGAWSGPPPEDRKSTKGGGFK